MDKLTKTQASGTIQKRWWCMGCGAYGNDPCDDIGHLSQDYKAPKTKVVIAATYEGRLVHLQVKLPE